MVLTHSSKDTARIYSDVKTQGKVRMEFDYKLFKGVSVQMNDVDKAEESIMRMASSSAVKNVWPVMLYSPASPVVDWSSHADFKSPLLHKRQSDGNETTDGFAPHVMTQIDKLHAKGIKGKGIKIAVIDTGVSCLLRTTV